MKDVKMHFIIIGCGGTGGNFIKEFARFLYSCNATTRNNILVTVVDGDVVEEKNIARQPFERADVGCNKAESICQAIYEVFGLSFGFSTQFIDNLKMLDALWNKDYLPILVGCVDNHAARRVMHSFFQKRSDCIYMDAANEYSCGEVIVGSRLNKCEIYPDRTHYYPDVLKGKAVKRSQESCQVLNNVAPQHLATNLLAANLLLISVVQLIAEHKICGGIYLFDAFKGFSRFDAYVWKKEEEEVAQYGNIDEDRPHAV